LFTSKKDFIFNQIDAMDLVSRRDNGASYGSGFRAQFLPPRDLPIVPYSNLNRGPVGLYRDLHIGDYRGRFDSPIPSRRGYINPLELLSLPGFQDIYPSTLALNHPRRFPHTYSHYDDRYRSLSDCGTCRLKTLTYLPNSCHQHSHQLDNYCSCNNRKCSAAASSSSKSEFDFKTKDITIRGKARAVRASYLTEAPKFEADLVKYLDKKKEDVVPDRVIGMLVDFINCEDYKNSNVLDEVTLNILAHNVGAKSAVDYSLSRLKKLDIDVGIQDLTNIVGTIMMCSKVDAGLKAWLKKYLQNEERLYRLSCSIPWANLIMSRPEIEMETMRLLGRLREPEDEGFRML
jgi:hypothetical protein